MLSDAIGYHFAHIFHIHNETTSVVLTAEGDDCIPFYFWYLENMKKEGDQESSNNYKNLSLAKTISAHRIVYAECCRLLTDWEKILEIGYKCKDPWIYGPMFHFDKPIIMTNPNERKRLKVELGTMRKLTDNINWNKDELVLLFAHRTGIQKAVIV